VPAPVRFRSQPILAGQGRSAPNSSYLARRVSLDTRLVGVAGSCRSGAFLPQDHEGADALVGKTAEVVGEAEHGLLLALALLGAALHLQVHLVNHAQPRGVDGVAEALQAAVVLAGDGAVGVVEGRCCIIR